MIDETDNTGSQSASPKAGTGTSDGPVDYRNIRGDALNSMYEFATEHMRPSVASIVDPLSGASALVKVAGDGSITPIPASVFNDYLVGPRQRGGVATLLSLDSFIQHVKRFSDSGSVVFADNNRTAPKLTAVLDYHMADTKVDGATTERGMPRFGRHRSTFAFPLSDEWKAWNEKNGKPMKMAEFAHFLEDHAIDVLGAHEIDLSPAAAKYVDRIGGTGRIADPAALVTLAQNFEVFEQSNAGERQNLATGEGRVSLDVIHVDGQGRPLEVPTMFVLGIPVFKMGELFQIIARLRYRKQGGEIVFFYELWRLDLIFDTAFNEAVKQVNETTTVPVLLGSPEASA